MADNVPITPGTGTTIAADDVGGVLYQRVKVAWGPDGTGNDTDVASGQPLPVQLRSSGGTELALATEAGNLASIKAKTDNLDVALSTRLKPADTLTKVTTVDTITNVVHVDDNSGSLTVDGTVSVSGTVPVSGTFWQGTQPVSGTVAATQSGTWTVQPGNTANTTAWKVDGSAVTQPVSGTVTSNQGGTWTVQPGNTANTTAWKVDGSAVTQPVSGTFWQGTQPVSGTFWQGTQPVSLASGATSIAKAEDVASADADVGIPAMAVRKASPVNTSGTDGDYEMLQISAGRLWVDASGKTLTVDGSGVTQPVSGTVSATQSGTWTVQPGNTANTTAWKVDGSAITQPVSGTFWQGTQPVSGTVTSNQGGTWTVQPGNTANTTAWKVDGSAVTQPVSGTFWQGTQPVSVAAGATNIAKAEDVASADADVGVPAMAIRKATPGNTSGTDGDYEMLQVSAGRLWVDASGKTLTVDGSGVTQPVSGTVTANQGGTWTVQPGNTANTTAWKVDGSAVTQPVSGTVTSNQGGTWTVQPGNTANTTAWKVDGSAVTQPVSGTVTANAGTNLNTSALATEAGNLASIKAKTDNLDVLLSTRLKPADTLTGVTTVAAVTNITNPVAATQSGTWTVQPGNTANTTAWKVDGSAVTQPVSGTFWPGTQPVSGTFWQGTQPVSAASLPLPSNASQETGGNLATIAAKDFSTSAKQDTGNTSLSTIAAKDFSTSAKQDTGNTSLAALVLAQGATATSLTGPMVQGVVSDTPNAATDGTLAPLSLNTEGRLRVSVLQPIADYFDDELPSYFTPTPCPVGNPSYF